MCDNHGLGLADTLRLVKHDAVQKEECLGGNGQCNDLLYKGTCRST